MTATDPPPAPRQPAPDGDGQVHSPYWHLADPGRTSLWRMVGRFPVTVRPIVAIIWQAAPRRAGLVLGLQLASGLAAAFGLLATRTVLDELLLAGPTAERVLAALPTVAVVALAFTARGGLDAVVAFARAGIGPAVRRLAEERMLAAALDVELTAYDDAGFYDRLHRARDRGLSELEVATGNLVELLGALLAVAAASSAMGVLHPALLPLLLLSMAPEGWAVLRSAQLGYAFVTRTVTLDRRVRMVSELATEREAAAEVRACQAAPFVLSEYRQVADVLRNEQTGLEVARARATTTGRATAGAGVALTFGLLGLLLYAGWIPLAVAGAAIVAIRLARSSLTRLVLAGNLLLEQGLYVADYQQFLADARGRTRPAADRPAPAVPCEIELSGVGFRYPGSTTGPAALAGIDLTIRAGEAIALVGENGSGKTTLAKVLAGLYRPTTGRVRWDGVDAGQLDPESLADRVVMMQQEPVRWPNDVRTNIRAGRHDRADPEDRELHRAAAQAHLDEIVARLPRGWQTLLSKQFRGGHELSGGQWQRLAVARGLFRDAPLLIWDEPTARLDPAAEFAVYEALRALARNRTVVLITHRLASVREADRIYLLHQGRIVEQGSHAELLAAGGRYAAMFQLQQRMYQPEGAWQTAG